MRKQGLFEYRLIQCTALLLTVTLSLCDVRAGGVAVLKEHPFHRDSSATPVAYRRIITSQGPYLRIISGNRNIDILQSKLANYIEVPDRIPPTLKEERDLLDLRKSLADMKKFSMQYPLSAPLLKPPIRALSGHLSRFDAGEVRFEGNWITRFELAAILENRRISTEMKQKQEIIQLVFNEAQREKGLVLIDGKWMTEQEARKRPLSARTELSETLWPLINPDMEGARLALQNLSKLASHQNGALKVRTERLATVIKNLFIAEFHFTKQIIASQTATAQATEHERRAKQWLKPNAFGTIHTNAARDSQKKASAFRNQAENQLNSCRAELLTQLSEADVVTEDFHKLGEHRVALALAEIVRVISARRLSPGEFRSSFPDESLLAIRNSIILLK